MHQLSTPSLFSTNTMGLRLYRASGHGITPISSLRKQIHISLNPGFAIILLINLRQGCKAVIGLIKQAANANFYKILSICIINISR